MLSAKAQGLLLQDYTKEDCGFIKAMIEKQSVSKHCCEVIDRAQELKIALRNRHNLNK